MSKPMTHEEARDAVGRFNASHWNNPGEKARYSIPARPDYDDDIRLMTYINASEQQSSRIAELEAENADLRHRFDVEVHQQVDMATRSLEAECDAVRKALAIMADNTEADGFEMRQAIRELLYPTSGEAALLAAAREGGVK